MIQNLIEQNFTEMQEVLRKFACEENFQKIQSAASLMTTALQNGNGIFSCGNGGSMCDAMHFAEELTGRFRENRPAIKAVAISDPSYMSCVANDYGYDFVFSRYLEAWGKEGDVLLAISTSGNSKNVLQAIEVAKSKNMKIIGLTGKNGGKMADICDVEIRVEHHGYADRIQEIHIKVIHTFIQLIEKQLL